MMIYHIFNQQPHSKRKPFFLFSFPVFSRLRLLFILLLLTGLLGFSAANAAPSASSARKQVYAYAVQVATADIAQVARRKKWPQYSVKVNVFIPNDVSQFPACRTPLQVALPPGDAKDLARLRYDIRCDGPGGWEVPVTVKPDIYLPVLVATRALTRGDTLKAADVELKKHNISSLRGGYVTAPDEVIGLTVKRRVRDLQPVAASMFEQPLLVTRGQTVVMLAEQSGISIKAMGEAQKKGRKGDLIKVKNKSSGKVVTAVVDGLGVVRTLTAPGQ